MKIKEDKEERSSSRMHKTKESTVISVLIDHNNGLKGDIRMA
jgi:hypothetical protein